ncbi:unnamed protein product [Heligmosomoides polygyrus]|uniref:Reverse transcriptase domain-containing protein n=1 Tax=Heligmosomoides polygyrus TaxID=6339 RepID=A0A3P7WX45_HELPZ|nr:unnamed protein product [Heligmosomoides polygyrus]
MVARSKQAIADEMPFVEGKRSRTQPNGEETSCWARLSSHDTDWKLSAFEKSLLDGDFDDREFRDDFTEDNFIGQDDDAPPRQRRRGGGSRNRWGRRNRSRISTSSSSSSTSEDSDCSSDSQDASSRANYGAEDSHHQHLVKKETRGEGSRRNYGAASPLSRISKRIEFAASTRVAPEIVSIEKKKLRARVRITEEILEQFESCAMGMYVGREEKVAYFGKPPLIASELAAVPVLDEGLKVNQFRLGVDEHSTRIDYRLYRFKALPFGLNSAPYVYTRLIKPVTGHLRNHGIRVVVYLDDWLFMRESIDELEARLSAALYHHLGLLVILDKSHLIPTRYLVSQSQNRY